jgi:hypothetical protein
MGMTTINYDFSDDKWVTATCTVCGEFCDPVPKRNLDTLEQKARMHLREEHGEQT